MTREFTNRMIELLEEGVFDKDMLIRDMLAWMTESSVKEFVERYEFFGFEDLQED